MYDAVIIGAGMSGLAAGIRLAMFDKKVVILEKHSIAGGLNSYYQRKNTQNPGLRLFDVGLHALTNFCPKGTKGAPLTKLTKQLRLSYDDLKLHQQTFSQISFPGITLKFSNDFALLETEIREKFPHEFENFLKLVECVKTFNELDLNLKYESTRARLKQFIHDPLLEEMLLCPLLIYGSAWEEDMDFAQFVIMFKSLYFEGFSRPEGGVRRIITLLTEKFIHLGGELKFKKPVTALLTEAQTVIGVKSGDEEYRCKHIFSSIGFPETVDLAAVLKEKIQPRVGKMTFMESIFVFDKKFYPTEKSTITFYNDSDKYKYCSPEGDFDSSSAVICFPDNYESHLQTGEGLARVTYIAQYEKWKNKTRETYLSDKDLVAQTALKLLHKMVPDFNGKLLFTDVFSPTTVEKYTWHKSGVVYGSIDKTRDGLTPLKNLFIIGTDQGFLGIVGSILSGISMANKYGLMESEG